MTEILLKGKLVDNHTRCEHWHSELDIIALKFKCCETFYPCYECHKESTSHEVLRYHSNTEEKVVLCGNCNTSMTFAEYQSNKEPLRCPYCMSKFNPGCSNHYDLYFEFDK